MSGDSKQEISDGCYLTFSDASHGVLFEQWTKKDGEFKEEMLAFFRPNKSVPGFKYKRYGGKTEIIREIQATNIRRYYQGFTHYLKTAKEYKGELELLQENAEVYYLDNDNGVHKLETKENHALEKMKISAFAVIPMKADTFEGVKTLSKGKFLENGRKKGASIEC
eukprot:CAMPEP_0185260074 /NCGR_PEP_ID=MMETSP1359-20130426/8728_1 /TAXON_ID=552665 /ORGANISM="Bigelowiella longifila, Strain CCMP242" /LENGTH=165 /DNA_ID=CAMNT_0027846187 /DNA_START=21 /DNA_END=518 /DNA_ORIENTATION=+